MSDAVETTALTEGTSKSMQDTPNIEQQSRTWWQRNSSLLGGTLLFWLALVFVYVTAAIVDASRAGREFSELEILKNFTAGLLQWLILTPLLVRFFASPTFLDARREKRALLVAGVFTASFVGIFLYIGLLASWVWSGRLFSAFTELSLLNWIGDIFLFVIISLGGYLMGTQQRARAVERTRMQLEHALVEQKADLNAREAEFLRGRLGSHFVMNALSNLVGLMRLDRVGQAEEATILLSDILRSMTGGSRVDECISVEQSVEDAKKYLAFQQIRYPDLQVTYDIAPVASDKSLPRQLLQPLLENVFKHGPNAQSAVIQLSVCVEGDMLQVSVRNNCEAKPADTTSEGEGLKLTRLRLENVFGPDYLVTRQQVDQWYETVVRLPAVKDGEL